MAPDDSKEREKTAEEKAAHHGDGQNQDPVQSDPDRSSTVWDTDEHSDAPGPFGTGGVG